MPLPRSGRGRGRGRGGAVAPAFNSQQIPLRGRGSSANALPTYRRGGGSAFYPTLPRRGDRARRLLPGRSSVVHFDVPVAGGREIISVDYRGERTGTVRCLSDPVIFVALGRDGLYSTESVRGRFESIDKLMHAFSASWPSPCTVGTPSEEQQHVGSSSSAQTPHPGGLQHQAFRGLPSKEQHVAEPASAQTLHKLDALSLKERYSATMEGFSTTAASLPSLHDTIEASPPSSLSSSPIWKRRDSMWGITFYTTKDLRGYFHTFPHVGGPFDSKDEANKAIDRYLSDHEDLTMGMGLSELDKLVQRCRFFPDGTKKRLKAGQSIDKRRDTTYQLVQAVVYKYNDHHHLFGDCAYEVKDVLYEPSLWEEENSRMCMHMNFTAKTKGSDGSETGSDNLFFAEVTYELGVAAVAVTCCCMVKPSDNGICFGCLTPMKHPTDGNAYTGGRRNTSYCLPFGSFPVEVPSCYDEDSDEEVERLRCIYRGTRTTARVPLEA